MRAYLQVLADLGVHIQTNKSGFLKTGLGKVDQELGESGRKQQGLTIGLEAVQNLMQLDFETHFEQTIELKWKYDMTVVRTCPFSPADPCL